MAIKSKKKSDKNYIYLKIVLIVNASLVFLNIIVLIIIGIQIASINGKLGLTDNDNNSIDSNKNPTDAEYLVDDLDWNAGEGKVWADGIFAPFVDMGAWVNDTTYSNNGTMNLKQIHDDTGTLYYNLGFINAVDSTVTNGILNWGWGAYGVLTEGQSNAQYEGIKKSMREVREAGGDVTISFGGLNERNFFQYTTDIDVLVNTYVQINRWL